MYVFRSRVLVIVLLLVAIELSAGENVDLAVIHRIKAEAFNNSQVMDHLFQLTDVNGPRLTGSPGFKSAAEWAVRQTKDFGLEHARLEPWGPFGRGWSCARFDIEMSKPTYAPLHGAPMAWCEGTKGAIRAEVLAAPFLREEDTEPRLLGPDDIAYRTQEYAKKWRGKLHGKIILLGRLREFDPATEAPMHRLDDKDMTSVTEPPELGVPPKIEWPIQRFPRDAKKRRLFMQHLPVEMLWEYIERHERSFDALNAFLRAEGVAGVLRVDKRGSGGIVFAEAAASQSSDAPLAPPSVMLVPEHYNRLWRLLDKGVPVEVHLDLAVNILDSPTIGNVVAEIPGGARKEEIVMLGAHLDSWHTGTGATDNAAGCAVILEATRILKALGLKMDRTVRLALWSGEEQGLYGSRAYVREHFGDPITMAVKPDHAKLVAYFNVDNGSGKIRGIHLQGNEMVRPIFEAWMAPFKDLGVTTITIRDTGGTDHLSFDSVGLPGFQFIQDPLDYGSRTHHSELDVYDHAEPGDLMQASAVLASFVYHAATREAMLPRKPLPKPLPPKKKNAGQPE